ncbi:MAG: hypothetical protein V7L14_20320 [Nostoc sp.]|uniref:hypothetical protein n=1 Tax=Nostoc sp. TaxID=1180 RepID=UPI002FFC18D6
MSKIIYDVIQRFEVENGVPRLVSTNIQVIEGGEDLLSLAISMLEKLGFYDKFEEKRTSQYIGYRLKNPGKGAKRYQLILAQRKEGLCISIPQEILEPYLLKLNFSLINSFTKMHELKNVVTVSYAISTSYWIRPSKKNVFFDLSKEYRETCNSQIVGEFELNSDDIAYREAKNAYYDSQIQKDNDMQIIDIHQEYINKHPLSNSLDKSDCCLKIAKGDIGKDKLFNYAYQVAINSREVLEEFLAYFAKILMGQQ